MVNRITQGPEQSTSPSCLVILSYFSEKLRDHKSGLPPGHTDRDAASAPSPNCPKYGTLATVGWPTDRRALRPSPPPSADSWQASVAPFSLRRHPHRRRPPGADGQWSPARRGQRPSKENGASVSAEPDSETAAGMAPACECRLSTVPQTTYAFVSTRAGYRGRQTSTNNASHCTRVPWEEHSTGRGPSRRDSVL